jgi:hypothetical protein
MLKSKKVRRRRVKIKGKSHHHLKSQIHHQKAKIIVAVQRMRGGKGKLKEEIQEIDMMKESHLEITEREVIVEKIITVIKEVREVGLDHENV